MQTSRILASLETLEVLETVCKFSHGKSIPELRSDCPFRMENELPSLPVYHSLLPWTPSAAVISMSNIMHQQGSALSSPTRGF